MVEPLKRCAVCGVPAGPGTIECTECGSGRFETSKVHREEPPASFDRRDASEEARTVSGARHSPRTAGAEKRNWTDSRDGSEWEINATPILEQQGDGDSVAIGGGGTSYTLRFDSQDSLQLHRLVVSPDVAPRLSELTDSELAELLDEARRFA